MFHAGGPPPPAPTSDWLAKLLLRTDDVALHDYWGLQVFPIVAGFALRDAGYVILCAVMRCAYTRLMPTTCCAIPVSYDAVAERFHVSRTHVANLLREARAAGWFAVESGSLATIDAAMVEQFEAFFAQQFAHFGLITHDMETL